MVWFYKDALDELRANFKYHKDDKHSRKAKISDELKSVLNKGANIIDIYRNEYGDGYLEHPFSSLINEFISVYYRVIEEDSKAKRETDLDELSQGLLLEFIEEAMGIRSRFGFDDFGSRELTGAISSIRKDIAKLKIDCLYFAENCKNRDEDYFSPESIQLTKLKELKSYIDRKLGEINPDTL